MEAVLEILLRVVSAGSALIAVICAVYVARRASNWRESDEAKALERRVTEVERDLSNIAVRLDTVPTREDLAALKSEVRALSREVGKVDDGVSRIEIFLIERGAK